MHKTPSKTPGVKTPGVSRTPLSRTPLGRFTPGRTSLRYGGRKCDIGTVLRTAVPICLVAFLYFARPRGSAHDFEDPDDRGSFIRSADRNNGVDFIHTEETAIEDPSNEIPNVDTALQKLAACADFDCIKQCHAALDGRTRFNLPHFFLIGWQKCATTSVNLHLRSHPQYLPSPVKESHYFTTCQNFWNHPSCMAHNTSHYIKEFLRVEDAAASRLERVSVDASVDYAWKGQAIAPELHRLFPWIKLVVIMREPLSRLISYVRMYTQREHEVKGCMGGRAMYDCLQYHLDPSESNSNYSGPLEAWFNYFPPEQFHIIQFEELQEDPNRVVRTLKVFLGMDPDEPKKELKNTNLRKSGGYNMTREQYEGLIGQVRWDAEKLSSMLAKRGLADKLSWMKRWEEVWQANLDTCDEAGNCLVNSN